MNVIYKGWAAETVIDSGCFAEPWTLRRNLDLLQLDLTSFEASGASFTEREATERATKSRGRMTLKFSV